MGAEGMRCSTWIYAMAKRCQPFYDPEIQQGRDKGRLPMCHMLEVDAMPGICQLHGIGNHSQSTIYPTWYHQERRQEHCCKCFFFV
ncbi:hypothetical protein NC652_007632 [Populus alba x Populus x berolinensis]|nr:hypothetical protein NC652_007632 [Populus alba x Populus x berolinensis]